MFLPPPPPPTTPTLLQWGYLIWKLAKILWGQNFFLHLWRNKPLWGELKFYGGSNICYYTFIISFVYHPEKWSVSLMNSFRKCECIKSCYLPISSNLLKKSFRKTSIFVLIKTAVRKSALFAESFSKYINPEFKP